MDSSATPNTPEPDDYAPELLPDEEELSSGNSRLALIAGGIVAAVLAGYLLLPASVIRPSSAPELPTPTMELGEAGITASRPTDNETDPGTDNPATITATTATAAAATANRPSPTETRSVPARIETPVAASAANDDEPAEPVPAAVAPVAAAVPEPVELAPTTLKMNGRVLDENGRPLAGATILLKGSKAATSTDASGNYSLEVPAGADNTLLYGYGGYEDQLLRSRNTKTQNVTLVPKESAKRRKR